MNDNDLKSILIFLSKHGKYETVTRYKDEPEKFYIPDRSGLFNGLKRGGDGASLSINFKNKKVRLHTWQESYHNGDHYGETNSTIPWEQLAKYDDQIEKLFKEVLKEKALERIVNEHALVLRDKVLEAGGKLE